MLQLVGKKVSKSKWVVLFSGIKTLFNFFRPCHLSKVSYIRKLIDDERPDLFPQTKGELYVSQTCVFRSLL